MGFRDPLTSLSVSQLLPGAINGLWTLGNVAGAHAEIGTNAGGQSGIRLYAADGVTVLIDLDAATGNGTFQGDINASTVTGSTVTASNISGSTVTGGTVETAASGQRVALEGATNSLRFYDSGGLVKGVLNSGGVSVNSVFRFGLTLTQDQINIGLISSSLFYWPGDITLGGALSSASVATGAATASSVASTGAVSGSTVTSTTGDVTAQNTCTCLNPPATTTAANVWMNTSTGRLNKVTSARRFKKRIRRLRDGARVLALRPVSFQDKAQAKADPDAPRLWGFIADEVAQVAPELVSYDDRGRPEGVMYDRVVVGLLDVVRDLEHRCAAAGI